MTTTSTNLMTASNELKNRPADEHFASFAELHAAARRDDLNALAVETDTNNIAITVGALDKRLAIQSVRSNKTYPLTYHSARSVARLAGANPDFVFGRLKPEVAALALSDSLARTEGKVMLHLGTVTKAGANPPSLTPMLRGVTSPGYTRVSDASLLHEVNEWLLPVGFEAARPTKNTNAQRDNIMGNNKPCLFRGGESMFAFFMAEETQSGAGGRPVRRGVIVENSEVGASSVWLTNFVFDDLCANFIIWGAREMVEFRAIHRGDEGKILHRVRKQMRELTPTLAAKELEVLRRAAEVEFATTGDKAVERLVKQFELSHDAAAGAVTHSALQENRGVKPLSFAGVANGLTSYAKAVVNADKLVELATVGGDIYLAAGKEV